MYDFTVEKVCETLKTLLTSRCLLGYSRSLSCDIEAFQESQAVGAEAFSLPFSILQIAQRGKRRWREEITTWDAASIWDSKGFTRTIEGSNILLSLVWMDGKRKLKQWNIILHFSCLGIVIEFSECLCLMLFSGHTGIFLPEFRPKFRNFLCPTCPPQPYIQILKSWHWI